MEFKREIVWNGPVAYIPLPVELWDSLGIKQTKDKPEISIMPDTSKHGEYIAVFNRKKQEKDCKKNGA